MPENDEVIEQLENTPEVTAVMTLVRPYMTALVRVNDVVITNKFTELVTARNWIEVDKYMWPLMNDDERDILSKENLDSARRAVDNMHILEKLMREIVIKVVFYLLKVV